MAITHSTNRFFDPEEFNVNIETQDYAIGGKMVIATKHFSELTDMTNELKDEIRKSLIHQIADAILHHGLAEFTQYKDPISFNTVVRARCFLTPNDQVKILRTVSKIG